MQQLKGQSRAPDVLDMGTSFAIKADQLGLLAPYRVATYSDIPANGKASDAAWYDDYGGFVAIGYNPAKVKVPPTSFKSLENPIYKNQIAINNNPTEASAAFCAVWAAALANGGSFTNIEPGVNYFAKLRKMGNFVPVVGGPTTVQNGSTPILIWWDYLLASEVKPVVPGFKIVIPSDGHFAAYYSQAISKTAPDPAAARLWEEYLYSTIGQNLWLQGAARPIELSTLTSAGTVNKTALAALPPAPATLTFPSNAQYTSAENVVAQQWAKSVLG
jgi:putative spermidine/putrescine transport system substrate-binding protein